jgi:DNA-binding Lrp family transcriptional regulator
VPPERVQEVGDYMATIPEVTHCYLRPTYSDWPYNVFSMVHSKKVNMCDEVLAKMSEKLGIKDYCTLYSGKEYKKVRLLYFVGDIEQWEQENGLPAANVPAAISAAK